MSNYWSKKQKELEEEEKKKKKNKSSTSSSKSSNSSNYWQERQDELDKEIERRKKSEDDDIAPVRNDFQTPTQAVRNFLGLGEKNDGKKKDEGDRKWFQKGAFEDGYQFGDITKTILGTTNDISENAAIAVVDATENLIDTAAYGVGVVGGIFSDEFQDDVGGFIAKDLLKSEETGEAINKYLNPLGTLTSIITNDDTEGNSVLGDKSDNLVQSGAHLAGSAALQLVGVPAWLTMGVNAFGSEIEAAYGEGATHLEAGISGAISAGAEILFEKFSSGIKILKGTTADEAATKWLARNISNKVVRTLAKLGMDVVGEGSEEVATEAVSAVGRKLTYADEKEWKDILSSEDLWDAFVGGAVMGGVAGGGKAVKSSIEGKDYTSELTDNEEKVVKKIYEERVAEEEAKGKKLDTIDKNKIYDSVLDRMEKGGIDIDTIESVLGGETYKSYQDTVANEEALQKEYDTLYKMKNGEKSDEQIDRQAELKRQLEELRANDSKGQLKTKLGEEVFSLAKDTRLVESYNERARRGQAFEADLTQYDTKYHDTLKRAAESGILNNTRRTHEFVDMVAKISADKGVSFDFTDNAKLKESSFAVDGKFVNGYLDKASGTIGVNIDSAKALNTVVGHEITHVLEGTELYTEMQNALFEYAKSRNEFDTRREALAKLYAEEDIDSELTADLVGDYLFTDNDFINNLSTKHRNVFQKIYDEIKYMLKVATAGSKEARELERIKHEFEKAYKESAKVETTGEVQYALSKDIEGNVFVDVTEDIFDANNGESVARTIQRVIHERFNNLIDVHGQKIQINKTTNDEFRRSNSADSLLENAPQAYNDKLKTIANADEILSAAKNWIGEEIKHTRADDIVEFARGNVMYRVGENGYVADVIVGTRKNGSAVLYDLVNIYDKKITEAPVTMASYENPQRRQDTSVEGIVPQTEENVKTQFSLSDSDGKQLTKEQGEYFKDSKMRDDNGNLKVMYHGSQDAGFHIFDSAMSDDDTSFFFVDRNDVAASYSGTSETYEAQTIRTAEDMNNFLAKIGYDNYKAVEKDGKFELIENNEHVAYSDTAQGLYDEFCWYEGVGEGDANYKVYLNLTNPLVVDAEGKNWNNISREYSQEVADRYNSLTAEEKAALVNLAEWGEYGVFKDEMLEARAAAEQGVSSGFGDVAFTKTLARAYAKLGGANANLYDAFSIASDNFSAESIQEFAVKQMNTRDYAKKAKAEGYDGVIFKNIHDNGGYSNGSEGASTVAIAFDSNQIKSVANEKPTGNADIRYSLSDPKTETNYNEAVERGDTETTQKIVEDVAKESGYAIRAYHGTSRGDRVGNVFLPERATSGPMAFFTDNKEIAEGYSKSKRDTSMAYDPDFDRYETQFRIKTKNQDLPLYRAWGFLPFDARNRITKNAGQLREDWDGDYDLILDPDTNEANGGFQWQLKEARGNAIQALTEQWLNSGTLFNEESRFLDVLEKAGVTEEFRKIGMDSLYFKDPNAKHEKVYDVFLKITKPFDTADVDEKFVEDFEEWYGEQDESKYVRETADSDLWDKNNIDAYDFAERLLRDIERGTFHAWTSIPDSATDYLKHLGYNGIKDAGGKNGGAGHTVWIPFSSEQIKSAEPVTYDDSGNVIPLSDRFNEDKSDIRYSLSAEGEAPQQYGNFNIFGKDIRLEGQEDVAPVDEAVDKAVAPEDIYEAPSEANLYDLYRERDALLEQGRKVWAARDISAMEQLAEKYDALKAKIAQMEANEAEANRERLASLEDTEAPLETDDEYYNIPDTSRLNDESVKSISDTVKDFLALNDAEAATLGDIVQRYSTQEISEEQLFEEIKENFGTRVEEYEDTDLKDAKRHIRKYPFKISDMIKQEIAYRYGSYNDFRKKHFGKIRMVKDGLGVDSVYMELSELYPQYFPADVENPADQFSLICDVVDADVKKSEAYRMSDEDIQEVVDIIATETGIAKDADMQRLVEEERQAFMDDIAPVAENIAPVAEDKAYETIRPKRESKEPKMIRVKEGEDIAPTKTAEVLVGEPEAPKQKRRAWSWFVRNFVDKQSVFETLSLKTGNRKLQAKANFILSSEARAQRLIGKGTNGVKALNDIRKDVEKSGLTKQFYEYMYHKHNVDRMSLEERYGTPNKAVFGDSVTSEVSTAFVAEFETKNPQFKKWAQECYDYMSYLRKKLVDNGVISQETADLWAQMYPHYVPIRRVGDNGANINVPLDTGRTGVNAPVKRATGGNSEIADLFNTMAMRTEQTYRAIAKNSFGVELKNTLGSTIEKGETSVDEMIDSIDAHEELLKKGENGANPTFTVFENGEKVTFEITEEMYDALKPKSEQFAKFEDTKAAKVLRGINTVRRGLITEYNPVFLATNAFKDSQDVLWNSQHAAATYANMPVAAASLLTNGKYAQEYLGNGGEGLTYFDGKKHNFKEDKGIKKIVGMPLRAISAANNFVERVPRLAEYIASRKAGATIEEAMLDAARVTTNFAAGGDVTRFANTHGATFLNASVQGAAQQVRNIREAKAQGFKGWVKLAAKTAIMGIPALILNNLLWDDDEEYEELSDYVKDNYYIVAKYGDGQFVRIPKGRTVAVIQDAFEQISNALTGDDEVDLANFLDLAISNLAPNNPFDNNIFAPIRQALSNNAWYGDDIVPSSMQDLPAAEQYDESTDAISKWLGEKTNTSPMKWNYLLDQYSGGVGDVFLPMLTPEAERGDNTLAGNLVAPFKDKFTTDSVMNNQNVSDFYDVKDELAVNANGSNATDEDLLKSKYMNSVNAELGELYGLKREVQNSDLPDDRKYEKVREIQAEINAIARESLNTYNDVYIGDGYAAIGDREYKLNNNGEWQKISDKQAAKQDKVTSDLGISESDYWGNKSEYDFAYEYPEKYAVAKSVGGYEAYKTYNSDLYDIKADKDENGKTIVGSRKDKVADYINNLDIDYGMKIILYKSEYKADDTYNSEIVEYLNGREDISYEEMVTILTELGFTVKGDTVTWD